MKLLQFDVSIRHAHSLKQTITETEASVIGMDNRYSGINKLTIEINKMAHAMKIAFPV
jgi:hypothetical protein